MGSKEDSLPELSMHFPYHGGKKDELAECWELHLHNADVVEE